MSQKLVFVHGFYGGKRTWGKFPELLKNTIDCKVSLYGFDSFYFPLFGNSTSIHQLAEGLLSEIKVNNCFDDDLILVGHSLGGLVIRQLLLNLELKKVKHNITKIAFFAVPHDGTGFASLLSNLPLRCNKLKALNKDGNFVEQLNDQWSYTNLDSRLEIMSVIGGKDAIVTSNSAKSIFRYHDVETNIDAGHKNIVKPKDENDLSFNLLRDFINRKKSLTKYKNKQSSTYKEWFKLDRHHDLNYVQDKKTENNLKALQKGLDSDAPLIRLTGLSGLGKSRLIIEFLTLTNSLSEEDILIYDGADDDKEILSSIGLAITDNVGGLVIVETCSIDLHKKISQITHNQKKLKVITLNFYHNSVNDCLHIKLDRLEQDKITELLTQNLPALKELEINRLVNFIEGFPLLADMLIKQIRASGNFDTNFTEHDLVEKLINGDGRLSEKHREIIKVISLFDYIKCERDYNEKENLEANFINEIAESSQLDFERVITNFSQKELINTTGRFARVVPKPLALNLAMEWWDGSLFDSQSNLISKLPESMVESFCKQITFLDSSMNVQNFVEKFCEGGSPFGQAELLLSKQGSRLFRALVEVNPKVTSDLLNRILSRLSDDEISNIDSDVRRNFVWSLEMLVYHKSYFDKATWCLFKLAQFESENFSNNALGQFSQLFRWQLSGTEADFGERLAILDKALALNIESADFVIINAVKTAINTHGGTRTIGAEFQGTKPELTDWSPKTYQEVYDYWQSLLDILLKIIKRGYLVEQVKDAFGHEIRGLIRFKLPEKLDFFVKEVIKLTGKYWPSAAQSITHALHYDAKGMNQDQIELLKSWEKLLSPDEDSIEEQLKLVVLNPSREHVKDNNGHYIDMSAEDAKQLAKDLRNRLSDLYQHFELLMTFPEQKQTWVFAKHLVLETDNIEELLNSTLDYLRKQKSINTQFLSGLLFGLNVKEPIRWKETIELIGSDEELIEYYPDAIRTGCFESSHLDVFIKLISEGKLPSYSASTLVYGRATEHLAEEEIAHFCMSLSEIDATAIWVALDNMNMYTHGRNDVDFTKLRPTLVYLVLNASFKKEDKTRHSDSYNWLNSVERLLEYEDAEFALKLCIHLVDQVGDNDVDYSDLWDYLGNGFYKAFELHGNYIWPNIAEKFTDGNAIKPYRLIDLLGSGKSYKKRDSSIFDILNPEVIVDWCKDEVALLIVGQSISMFIENGEERVVNPLMIRLLVEFSDSELFLSEISANFSSRSWSGSLVPYLEADKQILQTLIDHNNIKVKNWAVRFIENIDHQIEYEDKRNAEEHMLRS
ncbi:esterase/lipase family protein [Zhongshania borealis]|uniref:AB hydrolase-1 domain-containing protein n=1 Tax=Zhongshania borealis TaxID=889488 RepID=A0ABP7X790_9GAMM